MTGLSDLNRSEINALNAKLHQGYDPSIEYKEQGHLYSAVQFEENGSNSPSLFAQLANAVSEGVRNLIEGTQNIFGGNHFSVNEGGHDVNLPPPTGPSGMADNALRSANGNESLASPDGSGVIVAGNALNGSNPLLGPVGIAGGGNVNGDIRGPSPSSSSNSSSNETNTTNIYNNPANPQPPINPVITAPPATGNEDQPITISIGLTTDPGSITSVTIGNIPMGSVLSAGVNNGNGTWTLTPAQLVGLTLTAPQNLSGNFLLTITAMSSENGFTVSSSSILVLNVNGVADTPTLGVVPASGNENQMIPIQITAALTDTDGSETLSIIISDVPNGAILSAGINNSNGTWTLTPAQLIGLTFTPPNNVSGNFNLTVTAIASENGTTASEQSILTVSVTGVASTPTLSVAPALGNEDTAILLSINAALLVNDGSETLSVVIGNVPTGAVLSAGVNNGNGTWTLTDAQLVGLTITPPANSNVDFVLSVTAISTESGHSAIISQDLSVVVYGVADAPVLSVVAANGNEDTAIALNIGAVLTDTDGSEQLSILISNVPDGAVLSAGVYAGNHSWALSPADLVGLTITPPENYNGVFNLQITAISTENDGNSTSVSTSIGVTVNPVADIPVVTVNGAIGYEDTAIALDIHVLANPSDIISILISNIPTGAILSAGINNGDGSWTLTAAQLSGLTITAPHNSDVDFVLNVSVTATENDGMISVVNSALTVVVDAVADAPNVVATDVSGLIDTKIALNISGSLTDTDGSENITYVISGIPDGFALNHGSNNGDNSWTLTPSQLAGLTLTSPYHFQGTLNLVAYSVSHEASNGDVERSLGDKFSVTIGDPLLGLNIDLGLGIGIGGIGLGVGIGVGAEIGNILNPAGIVIMEDSPLLLNGITSLLTSLLTPLQLSLIADVQIAGIPIGGSLSAGTNLGGGIYSLSGVDLNNVYLIAPPNSDQDFALTISVKLLTLITLNLSTTVVHVVGVADAPTLAVSFNPAVEGDTSIPIHITSLLTDTDGSETLSITLSNLPTGVTPNIGINNGDGTWTIPVALLASLVLNLPQNFSGNLNFTVVATSTEREGDSTNTVYNGMVHVDPVAHAPLISLLPIFGNEENNIALNLGISLADQSGSEHLSSVIIAGIPLGSMLSHGIDNHDGSWTVNPNDLSSLNLVTPQHWSGDVSLAVTATSTEISNGATQSSTANIALHVDALADVPLLLVSNETAGQDELIDLHIGSSLVDTDGSEHLSIIIAGVPDGATLSAGLYNGDGSWTLTEDQLDNLCLTPPEHFIGDIQLSATAYAMETSNGDTAHITQNFTVHVEAPQMMVNDSPPDNLFAANDIAPPPTGNDYDHAFNAQQSHTG